MTKAMRFRALPIAALLAFQTGSALAQVAINGGGATSPEGDYAGNSSQNGEETLFNSQQTKAAFGTYWGSGSTGETAFLNNDLTCDIDKVTGANGGACANQPGGANTVHYNASDSPFSATQVSSWSTIPYGQSAAGNLIQIPMLGTGEAIVVNDTNITANGQLTLSDNDLCGVFSGKISDFSQITDSTTAPAAGPITLVYRSDSSAATFILTNHLSAVCNTTNSNITFTATTTFASLFPGGSVVGTIPNAVGVSGSSGVANYLSGLSSAGAVPQAIGYVSPDWTSVPANPASLLSNGQRSELLVAGVFVGKKAYTPTTTNLELGLTHVVKGSTLNPPATASAAANPSNWVPLVQTVSEGYPIVGYGAWDLAQCYASATISTELLAFLEDHYKVASYLSIQSNNGLVHIANTGAAKFLKTVENDILANKSKWNVNIGNAIACKGLAGR